MTREKKDNRTKISVFVVIVIAIITRLFFPWWKKEEINMNQYNPTNSPQIANSSWIVINYVDTKDPNYLNPRDESLRWLQPIELVYKFFELQNLWGTWYRSACSLLQKNKPNFKWCDSQDGSDVEHFSSYVRTFLYGYENVYVTWSEQIVNPWSQIVCVRFDYSPNSAGYTGKVSEYYRYKLNIREDWEREISSRVCEDKIIQWIGHRSCWSNQPWVWNRICLKYLQ